MFSSVQENPEWGTLELNSTYLFSSLFSKLPSLNLAKDVGGLNSTGYVYIGKDPDTQGGFDVEDQDGQTEFTTVKLIRENIEDLL